VLRFVLNQGAAMPPDRRSPLKVLLTIATAVLVPCILFSSPPGSDSSDHLPFPIEYYISPMGQIARGDLQKPDVNALHLHQAGPVRTPAGLQGNDQLVHDPNAIDFQSETTIAVNGHAVVVGYNDIRGFGLTPDRVTGFSYSTDGGATWTDGGQLPSLGPNDGIFGDPDVKTWTDDLSGTDYFFMSSLYTTPGGMSSLCIHVSSDGGATWSAPREVTSATTSGFADKPLMDVDPETGRIHVAWSNFGTGSVRTSHSDDMGLTWSPAVIHGLGWGAVPRSDGSKGWAYVAWRTFTSGEIQLARSSDNGDTWSTAVTIVSGLNDPMNPYGSDRNPTFISMEVDDATGILYLVYPARQITPDFSDIQFIRSTNNAGSFSLPQYINAAPGDDRSQFAPWICVDETSSDISVIWYDQLFAPDGFLSTEDITDVFHTHSSDYGMTWTCPTPLTDRSFHAEAGNWPSQPNIGDYIQAVQVDGTLYAAFAKTDRLSPITFAPDSYVDISTVTDQDINVRLQQVTAVDAGCATNGYWEPGETIQLTLTLEDRTSCQPIVTGITGLLTTTSPYATVTTAFQSFGPLAGQNSFTTHSDPYVVTIDPSAPCGEEIDFKLEVSSDQGPAAVAFSRRIGRIVRTTLLEENFDAQVGPPPGWMANDLTGTPNPWTTSTNYFVSPPHSAFCADIGTASYSELVSPTLFMASDTDILHIQCSVTHNLDANPERTAFDGALLKVSVSGTSRRASSIGEMEPFYPWQMTRAPNRPLADYSCWSSNTTPNFTDVTWDIPNVANQTIALQFQLSTDATGGTPTGIFVDDVKVEKIVYQCDCGDESALSVVSDASINFTDVPGNETTCDTVCITNTGAADLVISGVSGCMSAPFSLDLSMLDSTVASGDTTKFLVCVNPSMNGPDTCEVVIESNDPGGPTKIPVLLDRVIAVGDDAPPSPFRILSVAPNPFNPETSVRFELPSRMPVTVEVWSVSGKRVRVLARDEAFGPGVQEIRWHGQNDGGNPVASGVYFIRISTPAGERTARAVLLK
jgi:hypothetical protein